MDCRENRGTSSYSDPMSLMVFLKLSNFMLLLYTLTWYTSSAMTASSCFLETLIKSSMLDLGMTWPVGLPGVMTASALMHRPSLPACARTIMPVRKTENSSSKTVTVSLGLLHAMQKSQRLQGCYDIPYRHVKCAWSDAHQTSYQPTTIQSYLD